MIIDCHGHYTTEPKPLMEFRQKQIAAFGLDLAGWNAIDAGDYSPRAGLKVQLGEMRSPTTVPGTSATRLPAGS